MFSHLHELHQSAIQTESPKALDEKSLYRMAVIAFFIALVGYAFKYYNTFLLTHALTTHEYGNYSFITGCVTLTSLIILFGIDKAVVKFLPVYFENKHFGEIHGFFKHLFLFLSIIFFITFLLSIILYYWSENPAHRFFGYPFERYLWLTPIFASLLILSMLLRVYNYRILSSATQSFFLFFFSIIFIKLFQFFTGNITFSQSILAYLLSILTIILISIVVLRTKFNWNTLQQHPPIFHTSEWSKLGLQLMLSLIIISTEPSLISILIKFFDRTSSAPIALYNTAYMLDAFMWIAAGICSSVYTPAIARAAASQDLKRLQAINNSGTLLMLIPGILTGLPLIIWGKTILGHFGASYVAAYPTLVILTLTNLAALCAGMSVYFLEYASNPKSLMKLTIIVSLSALTIGAFLCWRYHSIGAAMASGLLQISLGFACAIMVKIKLKLKPFIIF